MTFRFFRDYLTTQHMWKCTVNRGVLCKCIEILQRAPDLESGSSSNPSTVTHKLDDLAKFFMLSERTWKMEIRIWLTSQGYWQVRWALKGECIIAVKGIVLEVIGLSGSEFSSLNFRSVSSWLVTLAKLTNTYVPQFGIIEFIII